MKFIPIVFEPATELPTWLVVVLFGVPFVGGIILYIYKTRHTRSWRKGLFPQTLKPSEDTFLEAYLALAAKLILFDYKSSKNKVQFINEYFNRYFKFSTYNFSDSLVFSLKYPIKTYTITNWMKIHLKDEGARSQVVYFLTGLILVNGKMQQKELHFLQQINQDLELKSENLTRIIAIYAAYFKSKHESTEKISSHKNYSYEILGIEQGATLEQIKKAYRSLVKIHHPDNFATGSESQQKMAAEKFIEIQNAFNFLIKT